MNTQKLVMRAIAIIIASPFILSTAALGAETINVEAATVTGNPLGAGADELVVPVAVLNDRELSLRRESTLGETLNSIPGVSSSYFGPNASRPVIRGIDGDRVRMMQNGVGVLDASALSPDHAVPIDPLIAEQIEVIRGPATVLYGAGAVGGVVNVIDYRIPKEKLDGIAGRGEVRFGGADNEKSGAAVIDVGNGIVAIHADAYKRETNDLDLPGFAKIESRRGANDLRGKLVNSASQSNGGALGASLTFDSGYAGLAYSTFNGHYGTVVEEAVNIKMDSKRLDFATEVRDIGNIISSIKFRMAHTDYIHQEINDGVTGTTFKNRGVEGTLEAAHGKIGNLSGVVGFQFQNARFNALGDEAFVPPTKTVSDGIYIYEELPIDTIKLSFGGRVDKTQVNSDGGGKFGAAQSEEFTPRNLSAGSLYSINKNWSLGTNLTHTERAPTQNELFSNGPHLATGQFEIGDSRLSVERANGLDAQIRWKAGKNSFSVGGFYTRFDNFIFLTNTANTRGVDGAFNPVDVDGNGAADGSGAKIIREAVLKAIPATFKGFEAEGKFRVYKGRGNLDFNLRGDYVRASNRETGNPLPRIAPLRLGVGLDYNFGQFGSRLDVLHGFGQNRTDTFETKTDGYTLVNALVSVKLSKVFGGVGNLEVFAKAKNLLNDEIRESTSVLKDIAPVGGRSLLVGVRGDF